MLTVFTTPRAFHGQASVIQRNAIRSWCRLQPRPEIILFGDAEGTGEAAVELGVRHIPDIGGNEYGTPLVSAMFAAAERLSGSPLLCYVNADIILMGDFRATVQRVSAPSPFLMVGRRWNLDLREPVDFERADWEERLRARVVREGVLHAVTGIDYFVFPRGLWGSIPPFAIGRSAWDNWLIYRARAVGAAVLDATAAVMAVHQNHDYLHHAQGATGVWEGPEARRNQQLTGGSRYALTLADVTHVVTPSGIRPALSPAHLKRRIVTAPLFFPSLASVVDPLVHLARRVRNSTRRIAR
jgi:hypothetical protein